MFNQTAGAGIDKRSRTGRMILAVSLAGSLLLAGCGTTDTTQTATTYGGEDLASSSAPDDLALVLDNGQGAPTRDLKLRPIDIPTDTVLPEVWDFEAVSLDHGGPIVGAEIGAGPAIIGFVTPWCPVCQSEAPDIADAAAKNPDITYVLIHSSGTETEHQDFITDGGLTAANIVNVGDAGGKLWQRFSVVSQPSYVLVDSNGLLRSSVGQLEHDGLVRAADLVTAGF